LRSRRDVDIIDDIEGQTGRDVFVDLCHDRVIIPHDDPVETLERSEQLEASDELYVLRDVGIQFADRFEPSPRPDLVNLVRRQIRGILIVL